MILVLMIGFVSGLEVDFDCPDEIFVDEEFECEVEVDDGDGVYDLKVDLEGERNSALEIWDGDAWKSGYYYLIGFIEDKVDVRLRVSEAGKYDSVLKLRQDGNVKGFNIEIDVDEARESPLDTNDQAGQVVEEGETLATDYADEDGVIALGNMEPVVISLNGDVASGAEEGWDYVSKDGRIVDWLPYGFCLFLIFLVGIMMWERSA